MAAFYIMPSIFWQGCQSTEPNLVIM
jgi:hypothetical protein